MTQKLSEMSQKLIEMKESTKNMEYQPCIVDIYQRISANECKISTNEDTLIKMDNHISQVEGNLSSIQHHTEQEISELNQAYERLFSFKIGKLMLEPFGDRSKNLFINRRFGIIYDYNVKKVVGIYENKQSRKLTTIEKEFCLQNKMDAKVEWEDLLI